MAIDEHTLASVIIRKAVDSIQKDISPRKCNGKNLNKLGQIRPNFGSFLFISEEIIVLSTTCFYDLAGQEEISIDYWPGTMMKLFKLRSCDLGIGKPIANRKTTESLLSQAETHPGVVSAQHYSMHFAMQSQSVPAPITTILLCQAQLTGRWMQPSGPSPTYISARD
jgi:hypothetical protein